MKPLFGRFFLGLIIASTVAPGAGAQSVQNTIQDLNSSIKNIIQNTPKSMLKSNGVPLTIYLGQTKALVNCLEDKLIYGYDQRVNYYCATDGEKKAVNATAALMLNNRLTPDPDDSAYMRVEQKVLNLCKPEQAVSLGFEPERFYDEPAPAHCSGFKVGEKLIATAGHCVTDNGWCQSTSIVFGFVRTESNISPARVAKKDVYHCVRIVAGNFEAGTLNPDWRIIEVDRPIVDRPTVSLRTKAMGSVPKDTAVTAIGYPMGLPVKITRGGTVIDVKPQFFVSEISTYGGNSGSLIANADKLNNGEILAEGILVRGANDFVTTQPCLLSNRCAKATLGDAKCGGESATHSWIIKDAVP
ncbi:MAG: serine protease [Xanthobacteraceae bacterium]